MATSKCYSLERNPDTGKTREYVHVTQNNGVWCQFIVPSEIANQRAVSAKLKYTETTYGSPAPLQKRLMDYSTFYTDAGVLSLIQSGETDIRVWSFISFEDSGPFSYRRLFDMRLEITYTVTDTDTSGVLNPSDDIFVTYSFGADAVEKVVDTPVTVIIDTNVDISGVDISIANYDMSSQTIPVYAKSKTYSAQVSIAKYTQGTLTFNVNTNIEESGQPGQQTQSQSNSSSNSHTLPNVFIKIAITPTKSSQLSTDWDETGVSWIDAVDPPVINSISISDSSSAYSTFQSYIQSVSNLTFTVNVTPAASAGIKSVQVNLYDSSVPSVNVLTATVNGSNIYSLTSIPVYVGRINLSGSYSYTVTVIDSYDSSVTSNVASITFIPYEAPRLTSFVVERYVPSTDYPSDPSQGTPSDESARVRLSMVGKIYALSGNGHYNGWSITAVAKNPGDVSNAFTFYTDSGNNGNNNGFSVTMADQYDAQDNPYAFDNAIDYIVELTITDTFNSVKYTTRSAKAGGIFSIEPYGVAVGTRSAGTSTNRLFECDYDAKFYKNVEVGSAGVTGTQMVVNGNTGVTGNLTVTGTGSTGSNMTVGGNISVSEDASITGDLTVTGEMQINLGTPSSPTYYKFAVTSNSASTGTAGYITFVLES